MRIKHIYGCDAYPGGKTACYMTRVVLLDTRAGQLCLHWFHRSDFGEMHDHPWPFMSLILWGGYDEITPHGTRRYRPGSLLRRPAEWVHKVELSGRCAVTLVWTGRYCRQWGFHTARGWQHFLEYFREKGC